MPIELHEESNECNVMGRDAASESSAVLISERQIFRRLEPVVVTIHSPENMELVGVIELLQNLTKARGGKLWVHNTQINDVYEFLGVW